MEKNGKYYLALDGDLLEWPDQDKDGGYVTNALSSFLHSQNGQAYLRFLNDQAMGIQWGGIAFVNEAFVVPGVLTRGDVSASMTGSGLALSGTGVAGLNETFDVQRDKVNIQFRPEDGNWVAITIGDTPSALVDLLLGIGNDHNMMSFILGRQDDDHLRLSLWDGEKELMLVHLRDFDFSKAHTFGFIQHRGKYYFAIDDRMIEAVAMDGDDEVVTTWITRAVNRLSGGSAYVRVGNDTGIMECSQIRLE